MVHSPFDYDRKPDPPYDFVEVKDTAETALPPGYDDRILIHTVHDGGAIPSEFRQNEKGEPLLDPLQLERRYVAERDWGANLVAEKIASALGIRGFARCRIARVLLDFNRFPGSTPPGEVRDPLDRLAIHGPFSERLSYQQKVVLLERYYDRISDIIEQSSLEGQLIMVGVHTYDEQNPSQTRRPDVSIISLPRSYQREHRLPFGLFDPMYPDSLIESTCSRVLRDRISLNLERSGYRVAHNHPYALPDGSMEVRAQVWYFFYFLRKHFRRRYPDTRDDEVFTLVWHMLLNTNLRYELAEALRGYLHRYRKVSRGRRARFAAALEAYNKIKTFMEDEDIVTAFRRSPERPSNLALEVRKDLVCELHPQTGRPLELTDALESNATEIGQVVARAIRIYLETDRVQPKVASVHESVHPPDPRPSELDVHFR
jgi:predicted N-formylglutamate amidohydrolase